MTPPELDASVEARAAQVLERAGLAPSIRSLSRIAPIVSPMCRAADWFCMRVETDEAAVFLKLLSPDAAPFIGVRTAAAGARAAAGCGVGPALRFAFDDMGAMALDVLEPSWREARLGDLAKPHVLQAVLAAKRQLHAAPALDRVWDVFAETRRMAALIPNPPADLPALLAAVDDIRRAIEAAGHDSVPCHADGLASNIMIGPGNAIRLVDFDCAGMADPYYDIGILLNEVCALDEDWAVAGELAFSGVIARQLNRCRLYGVADDLLWGLWGTATHARSARTDLEFLKYGRWRLLRCRMALQSPGHASRLRHL